MKRNLCAIAVFGCFAAGAAASDELTVYGVIDAGMAYTNKSTSGTTNAAGVPNTGSLIGYQTNGESPSIFGGKGSKDLGGGMKAGFDLEGHFLTSSGAAEQWGGLFGRQANLFFSGPSGTLTIGTQYSPAVLAYAATDPRGLKESFSGLMTWAFTQTPLQGGTSKGVASVNTSGNPVTVYNTNSVIDVFLKNALSYSVKMPMGWMSTTDGLNVALAYSFGGVSGSTQANRVVSLGVSYTGPLSLTFAYQTENGGTYTDPVHAAQTDVASGTANEKYSLGAGYVFKDFSFKVNYLDNKGKNPLVGTELNHYQIYGLGVDYKASPKDTVTLAYYDGKNGDTAGDTAKTLILSNDYMLLEHLTLYSLVAEVNAGTSASIGSSAYNGDNFSAPPVPGSTSFAFQLGAKYSF